jgi:hypothetical protein
MSLGPRLLPHGIAYSTAYPPLPVGSADPSVEAVPDAHTGAATVARSGVAGGCSRARGGVSVPVSFSASSRKGGSAERGSVHAAPLPEAEIHYTIFGESFARSAIFNAARTKPRITALEISSSAIYGGMKSGLGSICRRSVAPASGTVQESTSSCSCEWLGIRRPRWVVRRNNQSTAIKPRSVVRGLRETGLVGIRHLIPVVFGGAPKSTSWPELRDRFPVSWHAL